MSRRIPITLRRSEVVDACSAYWASRILDTRRLLALWALVSLASAMAALFGYSVFGNASPSAIAFVQAFAGGAILTMLADTMMPEAFEHRGLQVGLFTTLGFALAFAIRSIE
jgi:ZIP family zinc transporter